ncbi:hypothetical protein BU17DRAFT_57238, partial [Hysterangium stoloniferum]
VLDARERILGNEHLETLGSKADLAVTYCNMGRWPDAERLEVQVLEARERILGTEHQYTLTSRNNLAVT